MSRHIVLSAVCICLSLACQVCLADHQTCAREVGIPIARANVVVAGGQCVGRNDSDGARAKYARVEGIIAKLAAQTPPPKLAPQTRLTSVADWPIVVFYGGRLENNAVTVPSGAIAVSVGLLNQTEGKDSELACALAHEMAHYLNGDKGSDQEGLCVSEAAMVKLLRAAGAGANPPRKDPAALKQSVAQEREADKLGVKIAAAAGYDPKALITFVEEADHAAGFLARQVTYVGEPLTALLQGVQYDHGFLIQRVAWIRTAIEGTARVGGAERGRASVQVVCVPWQGERPGHPEWRVRVTFLLRGFATDSALQWAAQGTRSDDGGDLNRFSWGPTALSYRTDGQGALDLSLPHGDWGRYVYTFSDAAGASVSVPFEYGRDSANLPTVVAAAGDYNEAGVSGHRAAFPDVSGAWLGQDGDVVLLIEQDAQGGLTGWATTAHPKGRAKERLRGQVTAAGEVTLEGTREYEYQEGTIRWHVPRETGPLSPDGKRILFAGGRDAVHRP